MDDGATKPKQRKITEKDQHLLLTDDQLDNKLQAGKNINTEKKY